VPLWVGLDCNHSAVTDILSWQDVNKGQVCSRAGSKAGWVIYAECGVTSCTCWGKKCAATNHWQSAVDYFMKQNKAGLPDASLICIDCCSRSCRVVQAYWSLCIH
jgi:hypothetical protein